MLHPYICNADEISKKAHSLLANRHPVDQEDFIKLVISANAQGFKSTVAGGALTMVPTSGVMDSTGGCYLSFPPIKKAQRLYSAGNVVTMQVDATISGLASSSGGDDTSEPAYVSPFSVVLQGPDGQTALRSVADAGVNQNGRYTFTATFTYGSTVDRLTCSVAGSGGSSSSHEARDDMRFAGVELGHFGATTLYPAGGIMSVHEYKIIASLANDYDPFDESKHCTSSRWFSMRPIDGKTWLFDGDYYLNGRPYPL